MHRVVIVDPNAPTRDSLRTMLLGADDVLWLEAECTKYEYSIEVIQQYTPDLVIFSLDADKNKALHVIGQLSAEHPHLPILTVSQNPQALLESLQRGAKYFVPQPVEYDQLMDAIRRALGDSGQPLDGGLSSGPSLISRTAAASKVIAVLGSRGGVGSTTLAVNLAATLAVDPTNSVVLLDLDLALGDADIALEVVGAEGFSISDLARDLQRLDMAYLKNTLALHQPTGLKVLRHPLEIVEKDTVHEGHIEQIINRLKVGFTHLVLDLSKGVTATDLAGLRTADSILLTCQLELSSLRNVVRLLHTLGMDEQFASKIQVVVNRVGSESVEEGISLSKAEEVIGRPIYWQVPNDSKPVIGARVTGQPLVTYAPKSRAQLAILGLANEICGKKPVVTETKASKASWFFGRRQS